MQILRHPETKRPLKQAMALRPAARCHRSLLAAVLVLILLGCSLITGGEPTSTPLTPTPVEESAQESSPTPTPLPPTATPEADPGSPATATPEAEPSIEPAGEPTGTPTGEPVGPIGPFTPFSPAPDVSGDAIRELRVAPNGTVWLATDGAVLSLDGNTWTAHTSFDALRDGVIVGFNDVGRPWVAAANGDTIVAQGGAAWIEYGPDTGWTPAESMVRGRYASVSESSVTDREGRTWLVTEADVRVFDGGEWQVFAPEEVGFTPSQEMVEMGFRFRLRDIAIDGAGDVWVTDCAWMGPGPRGQGARWYDGETWQGGDSDVVGSGCIEDIEVDATGRIWAGVDGNLMRYTPGGGWETLLHPDFDLADDLRWGYLTDLVLSDDDTAWLTVSLCGGASCDIDDALFFRVHEDIWSPIADQAPDSLAFDASGTGWLCAGDGLYRIEGDMVTPVHRAEGFSCQLAPQPEDAARNDTVWLLQPGEPPLWRYAPGD